MDITMVKKSLHASNELTVGLKVYMLATNLSLKVYMLATDLSA
jgi:hypothetical protein